MWSKICEGGESGERLNSKLTDSSKPLVKLVGSAIQTAKAKYYQESLNYADPKTTFNNLNSLQRKVGRKLLKEDSDLIKYVRNSLLFFTEKYPRFDQS